MNSVASIASRPAKHGSRFGTHTAALACVIAALAACGGGSEAQPDRKAPARAPTRIRVPSSTIVSAPVEASDPAPARPSASVSVAGPPLAPVPVPVPLPGKVPAPSPAPTGIAVLTWTASTSPRVTGYHVYIGNQPGRYVQVLSGGIMYAGNNVGVTLSGLQGSSIYYFAVTAVDASGKESAPSNEVFKHIP